jgi:serine/threonine protein kinase
LQSLKTGENLTAVFSKRLKSKEQIDVNLEDFEKLKVIGEGGFAEKVYIARNKQTGLLCAIKTVSKKFIL